MDREFEYQWGNSVFHLTARMFPAWLGLATQGPGRNVIGASRPDGIPYGFAEFFFFFFFCFVFFFLPPHFQHVRWPFVVK